MEAEDWKEATTDWKEATTTEALDRAYSLPDHVWDRVLFFHTRLRQAKCFKEVQKELLQQRQRPEIVVQKTADGYVADLINRNEFLTMAGGYHLYILDNRQISQTSEETSILIRRPPTHKLIPIRLRCLEIMNDVLRRHPEQRDLWSRLRAAYRRKQDLSWIALHDRFDRFLSVGATLIEQYFFPDAQQAGQWRKYDF